MTDVRVNITTKIWGIATGMLGIAKLRALEESIANLETIVSSPELDLPPKIKRLEMSDGA